MVENPMSMMTLRGEIPDGSKATIESNDASYENLTKGATIVDIKVTQPKSSVSAER